MLDIREKVPSWYICKTANTIRHRRWLLIMSAITKMQRPFTNFWTRRCSIITGKRGTSCWSRPVRVQVRAKPPMMGFYGTRIRRTICIRRRPGAIRAGPSQRAAAWALGQARRMDSCGCRCCFRKVSAAVTFRSPVSYVSDTRMGWRNNAFMIRMCIVYGLIRSRIIARFLLLRWMYLRPCFPCLLDGEGSLLIIPSFISRK